MTAAAQSFSTGDKVVWRGQAHTVDAVYSEDGRVKVLLRSDTGAGVFDYSALLIEGVVPAGRDGKPVPQPVVTVNHLTDDMVRRLVPDDEYRRMVTLRDHIREYDTGYRSGTPDRALDHEPKPQYDPKKVRRLSQREKNKSDELTSLGWDGVGHKNLERLRARLRDEGLWGLRRDNKVQTTDPLRNADATLVQVIRDVCGPYLRGDKSTVHYGVLQMQVQVEWERRENGPVKMPSPETFRNYVDAVFPNRSLRRTSRRKRSDANRPEGPTVQTTAFRPGELVQFDSTPVDIEVLDSHGNTTKCELTLAVDLFTRSILAWRVVPKGTNSVDVTAMFAQMLVPQQMRPGWQDRIRARYRNAPWRWLASVDERVEAAANLPVVWPETVVFDHGKVFINQAIFEACERLGISIQPAREGTPTDKPVVEATFPAIGKMFTQHLRGYTGIGVEHRGRNVVASLTMHQVEALFAEWVATVWQTHAHSGLMLFDMVGLPVSPNAMWAQAVATTGVLPYPPNPNLYLELLPTKVRTVRKEGVQIAYLYYDDPDPKRDILSDFREADRKTGARLPFKVDVNDVSRIYFQHPDTDEWFELTLKGADGKPRPFARTVRDHAIRTVKDVHAATATPEETKALIRELLVRPDHGADVEAAALKKKRRGSKGKARAEARSDTRQPIVDKDREGIQTAPNPGRGTDDGGAVIDIREHPAPAPADRPETGTADTGAAEADTGAAEADLPRRRKPRRFDPTASNRRLG